MATARCFSISSLYSLSQCFTSLRLCLPSCFTNSNEPPRENIFEKAFGGEERSSSDFGPGVSINSISILNSVIQDHENENSDDQINQEAITYDAPVRQNSEVDSSIEIKSIPVAKPENKEMDPLVEVHMEKFNKFILSGESDAGDKPKLLTPIRLADPEFETTPLKYTPIYDQNFPEGAHFPVPIQVMEEPLAIHHSVPRVLEIKVFDLSSPEPESSLKAIQNNYTSTSSKIEDLECLSAGVSLSPRDTRESSWGLEQPIFVSPEDPWEFQLEPLSGSELDRRQPATNDCSLRINSAFKEAGYYNPKDPANNGEVGRLNKPRPIESADMPLGDQETQPQPKLKPMTEDEINEIGKKSRRKRIKNRDFLEMFSAESFNDFFQAMESEQDPKSFFEKLSKYVGEIGSKIIPSTSTAPDEANRVSKRSNGR